MSIKLAVAAALTAAGSLPGAGVVLSAVSEVVGPGGLARPAAERSPVRIGRNFVWPLTPAPTVLRRFAVGPYRWSPGHRGVDLAAAGGQQVFAAGAGVVTFAGRVAGRGVVVVAHAGGLRTTYEPVAAVVRAGQVTEPGTTIGRLEEWPGHCPGPCLHWGALRGDVYVDPLSLLRPAPLPVLLPDLLPQPQVS
jgi:murein DD-endopeptidase MepM/ murein hydrolase activator NlpD